jgi:YesN/AraC family two-component response regulator
MLLDMEMEPGMDGLQTYKKISRMRPGQKAIVVSGFSENDKVDELFSLGVKLFLKKPYTLAQLSDAVHQSLKN